MVDQNVELVGACRVVELQQFQSTLTPPLLIMAAVEGKKIPHCVVDFGLGKAGAGDIINGEKLPNLAMSSTRLGPL